jgi:hypothetical protein
MRKPFGGTSLGAALGGETPAATTSNNEIWMSWFDGSSSADNSGNPAGASDSHSERMSERYLSSDREQKINIEDSGDNGIGGAVSADDRYNSMRQEIELAQRRLAVRERILTQDEPQSRSAASAGIDIAGDNGPQLIKIGENSSLAMRLQRRPQADSAPPLPTMALWGTAALLEKNGQTVAEQFVNGVNTGIPPVEKAVNKNSGNVAKASGSIEISAAEPAAMLENLSGIAVAEKLAAAMRMPQDKATKEMLAVDPLSAEKVTAADKQSLATRIPASDRATIPTEKSVASEAGKIGPFSLSESLRGPDSESSKLLKQYNLYDKFSTTQCHEHISWGPDGSVSVALKSADGYRRTIVCRADGTSAQRITDPNGKEIVRFSNGQVFQSQDSRSS